MDTKLDDKDFRENMLSEIQKLIVSTLDDKSITERANLVLLRYIRRTQHHIFLVNKCGALLSDWFDRNGQDFEQFKINLEYHDYDKLNSEVIIPTYAVANSYKYGTGKEHFTVDEDSLNTLFNTIAWPEHYLENEHHVAEYFSTTSKLASETHKDMQSGIKVPHTGNILALAEMVADWMAMGVELGNTANGWWKKTKGTKYTFSEDDTKVIESLLLEEKSVENQLAYLRTIKEGVHSSPATTENTPEEESNPVDTQEVNVAIESFFNYEGNTDEEEIDYSNEFIFNDKDNQMNEEAKDYIEDDLLYHGSLTRYQTLMPQDQDDIGGKKGLSLSPFIGIASLFTVPVNELRQGGKYKRCCIKLADWFEREPAELRKPINPVRIYHNIKQLGKVEKTVTGYIHYIKASTVLENCSSNPKWKGKEELMYTGKAITPTKIVEVKTKLIAEYNPTKCGVSHDAIMVEESNEFIRHTLTNLTIGDVEQWLSTVPDNVTKNLVNEISYWNNIQVSADRSSVSVTCDVLKDKTVATYLNIDINTKLRDMIITSATFQDVVNINDKFKYALQHSTTPNCYIKKHKDAYRGGQATAHLDPYRIVLVAKEDIPANTPLTIDFTQFPWYEETDKVTFKNVTLNELFHNASDDMIAALDEPANESITLTRDQLYIGPINPINLDFEYIEELIKYQDHLITLKKWITAPDHDLLPELEKFGKIVDDIYKFKKPITCYRGIRTGLSLKPGQNMMGAFDEDLTMLQIVKPEFKPGYVFKFNTPGPMSVARIPYIAKIYGEFIVKTEVGADIKKLVITPELAYVLQQMEADYPEYRAVNLSVTHEVIVFPNQELEYTVVSTIGDISGELDTMQEGALETLTPEELTNIGPTLYHGSPDDLTELKSTNRALFLSPFKAIAGAFVINKQDLLSGENNKFYDIHWGYSTWNMSNAQLKQLPLSTEITIYHNAKEYKNHAGTSTGYIYTIDITDDMIPNLHKFAPGDDRIDREITYHGKPITNFTKEKVTIKWKTAYASDITDKFGPAKIKPKHVWSSAETLTPEQVSGIGDYLYYGDKEELKELSGYVYKGKRSSLYLETAKANAVVGIVGHHWIPKDIDDTNAGWYFDIQRNMTISDVQKLSLNREFIIHHGTKEIKDMSGTTEGYIYKVKITDDMQPYLKPSYLGKKEGTPDGVYFTKDAVITNFTKEKVTIKWKTKYSNNFANEGLSTERFALLEETPEQQQLTQLARPLYKEIGQNSWNHIQQVVGDAIDIIDKLQHRQLTLVEYAALLFHDCSVLERNGDKAKHSYWSALLAKSTLQKTKLFTNTELNVIYQAILEHDADMNPNMRWTSQVAELVAAADFNPPNAAWILNKSYVWGISHGLTHEERIANLTKHIPAVYGSNGSAVYPNLYKKYHGPAIRKMQVFLDNLTEAIAEQVIMEYRKRHNLKPTDVALPDPALEYLMPSNETYWNDDKQIDQMIQHLPKVDPIALQRMIQPGDIIISYPSSKTLTTASTIRYKLNTFVQHMAYSSCKIVSHDKKHMVGYGVVPNTTHFSTIPIAEYINNSGSIIVLRHKTASRAILQQITRYIEIYTRKAPPYDSATVMKVALKRLFGLDRSNEITDPVLMDGFLKTSYCTAIIIYAFKLFGVDITVDNVAPGNIFPPDMLLSPMLQPIGVYFNQGELIGTEALSTTHISDKKKKIIDYICAICDTMDPSKLNSKRYHKLLDNMSDTEFDKWMGYVKEGKWKLHIVAPNMIVSLKNENILKAADKAKCKLFHRIWMNDVSTGRRYLTDNEYLILTLPVRRQQQFLDKKISVPEHDRQVNGMTGQVTGDSRACSFTNPEIQILAGRGLGATLNEFVNIRGGNVPAYSEFRRQAEETGEVNMNTIDQLSKSRAAVVGQVLLNAMHIDNNIIE